MNLPQYPKQKSTTNALYPDTPEHWITVPLKHVTILKGRLGWQGLRADEYTDDGPFLVTSEHFSNDKIDWDRCYHVSQDRFDIAPDIQLRTGDLMIMKDGAAMGKLAYVDHLPGPACLNSHLLLFRPRDNKFIPRFLYYVLGSQIFQTFLIQERKGTTFFGISQESIGNFPLAMPPVSEQTDIVSFLDRETAKIDVLVDEQRRLIELLKEKRQAVISRAVTKGLTSDTRMKDSGVEWLRELPAHWGVTRLGFSSWVRARLGWKGLKAEEYVEDGYVFLATPNIKGREIDFENVNFIDQGRYEESPEIMLREGDVLLAKDGSTLGTVNVVRYLPRPATVNSSIAVISPQPELDGLYLYYLFQSTYLVATIQRAKGGMGVPHLYQEDLNKFHLPLPPLAEQTAIAAFLDGETTKIDALVDHVAKAIQLLQEHRSALVSAAVTGKIDVREISNSPSESSHDRDAVRSDLALAIIMRFSHRQNFGRVKLQKFLYLAETYAEVPEIAGSYKREAAGPLDRAMLSEIETGLQRAGTVSIEQPDGRGGQVIYRILGRENQDSDSLTAVLGDRKRKFDHLLNELGDLDTKPVEAVATLFAVWNDFLIDGQMPTDDAIVSGVLNDWHPEKRDKFTADELRTWLGWMRRHDIVPSGRAPRTSTGRLFA
jgi:type I restriction enzyme, S subunit